jgi:hypothetical protein
VRLAPATSAYAPVHFDAIRGRGFAWSYVEIIVAPDAPALDSREQARSYVFTPGEGAALRYASEDG